MKFEKITDTKIKIILSLQEIELNNLSVEKVLSNSADSQKLLENMITQAEHEIGFKPEDSQLLVEATIPSGDECIFTITKLSCKKNICENNNNSFTFKFDSFDNFVNSCMFLNNFPYLCLKEISKNFALILYNSTYYLKFIDSGNSSIVIEFLKTFFTEFGKDVTNSAGIDGILNEYGKVLFSKNAIIKCINSFN